MASIVSDGLVFEVRADGATVELVGSAAVPPKGDLAVPASVTSGSTTYEVAALAKNAFAACTELTSVSLPATLREVDPDAVAGCPSLKSISVSAKNEAFASHDSMLFTKDYSRLLLIPEGMEGAAVIPGQTTYVPAQAFSRCLGSSLTAGDGSAEFASQNGMLFTKDLKTLIACPPKVGSAVVLPAETEAIGEYALAGCKELTSITALGNVREIDETAFAEEVKATAVVALPAGEDYDERKAVWEAAGFQHFAEPAEPGASSRPGADAEAASGFVFTLLDDYTLSVAWEGAEDPAAEVEIPASAEIGGVSYRVSTIADGAFANRASLTSVKLPASVTSIGEAAFAACANLASVSLPDSLQAIGERAFEATSLTDMWLPASVQAIGPRAFASCESLTRIVSLSTPEVADDALAGCANLSIYCPYNEAVAYPWNLGLIANNNHLLPYGLTLPEEPLALEVGQSVNLFDNGLVEAPEPCEVSYSYAAKPISVAPDGTITAKAPGTSEVTATLTLNNIELTRATRTVEVTGDPEASAPNTPQPNDAVTHPFISAIVSLSSAASADAVSPTASDGLTFTSADGLLTFTTLPDDATQQAVSVKLSPGETPTQVNIPQTVENDGIIYTVTEIAEMGFMDATSIERVTLPETLVIIRPNAFIRCSALRSITIPAAVETIYNGAFNSNTSLTQLQFAEGSHLRTIGLSAFSATALTRVTFPASLEELGSHAFRVPSLSEVSFAEGSQLKKISAQCFQDCTNLSSIVIPATVKEILNAAFANTGLSEVQFAEPSSLEILQAGAFNGCPLTSIALPASLREMASTVFSSCVNLKNVTFGDNSQIKSIGAQCFQGCTALENIVLPASLSTIGDSAFVSCSSLAQVEFQDPSTLETISNYAFGGCTSLRFVDLPDSVSSIAQTAFQGCTSLAAVHVGSGLSSLPALSFAGCTALGSLLVTDSVTSVDALAFDADTKGKAKVVLATQSDDVFTAAKSVWVQAGFVEENIIPAQGKLPTQNNTENARWELTADGTLRIECTQAGAVIQDLGWWDIDANLTGKYWDPVRACVKRVFVDPGVDSLSMKKWFTEMPNLVAVDSLSIPVSTQSVSALFAGDSSLKELPSGFTLPDTVKQCSHLFQNCSSLVSLPDGFRISNNIDDAASGFVVMFAGCTSLISLPEGFEIPANSNVNNYSAMFRDCSSLESLPKGFTLQGKLSGGRLYNTFDGCSSLRSLPDGFNLPQGAKFVDNLFNGCVSLENLPDSFSIPESMISVMDMFRNCSSLTVLPDGFKLPTDTLLNSANLFAGCSSLVSLPSGFTIPNSAEHCFGMFEGCSSLASIPSSFSISTKAKSTENMFSGCTALISLPEGFTIPTGITSVTATFKNCASLAVLPDSFEFPSNPENLENSDMFLVESGPAVPMYYNGPDDRVKSYPWASVNRTFYTLSNKPVDAKTITLNVKEAGEPGAGSYWTTAYTDASGMLTESAAAPSRVGHVFTLWYTDEACTQRADFSQSFGADATLYGVLSRGTLGGELPTTANSGYAFWALDDSGTLFIRGNGKVAGLSWTEANRAQSQDYWAPYGSRISKVATSPGLRALATEYWFYGCENLTDVSEFTLPKEVWSCAALFWKCSSLTTLPDNFRLHDSVTMTASMFRQSGIVSLPAAFTLPEGVTNPANMFWGCKNLASLPENFGFVNPDTLSNVFTDCPSLTTLPKGFTFPLDKANEAVQAGKHPFGCTIAPGEPRVTTYYEGSDPSVLNFDWASQNRTLVTSKEEAGDRKSYEVTYKLFNVSSGTWDTYVSSYTNSDGQAVDVPTSANDGTGFTGWCVDEQCLEPFDFQNDRLTADTTLYGKRILHGGRDTQEGRLPTTAPDGTLGNDAWWAITTDGTLQIKCENGSSINSFGWTYTNSKSPYWGGHRSDVKHIAMHKDVKAVSMSCWFQGTSIADASSGFFIPANCRDIRFLFFTCYSLEKLPKQMPLPENLQQMGALFQECWKLTVLPDDFTIPPSVKNSCSLIISGTNVQYLPEGFNIPEGMQDASRLLEGATKLKALPANFRLPKTLMKAAQMFQQDYDLTVLPAGLLSEASPEAIASMQSTVNRGAFGPREQLNPPESDIVTYFPATDDEVKLLDWDKQYRTIVREVPADKVLVKLMVPNNNPDTAVAVPWVEYSSQMVSSDTSLSQPSDPNRPGYKLLSWCMDAELTQEATFPLADLSSYAGGTLELYGKFAQTAGTLPTISPDGTESHNASWSFDEHTGTLHITCSEGETIANLGWTNVKGGEGVYYTKEHWAPLRANVKRVVMDPSVDAESMAFWFADMTSLTDATGIFVPNNGRTLYLDSMFEGSAISSLPDGFVIPGSVQSTGKMFFNCAYLKTLPEFFTLPESVVYAVGMFSQIGYSNKTFTNTGLRSLPAGFTLPDKLTDVSDMFYGCSFEALPAGLTVPSNATNAHAMFFNCGNLKELPSGFRLGEKLTRISNMFQGCVSLTSFPDGFTLPDSVMNAESAFQSMGLISLPSSFTIGENSQLTKARAMFFDCNSLAWLPKGFKLKHLFDRKIDTTSLFTVPKPDFSGLKTYYAGDPADLAPSGSDPVTYWKNYSRSLQVVDENSPLPDGTYQVVFNLTKPGGTAPGEWMSVMASASAAVSVPNVDAPKEFGYVFSGWRTQDGTAVDLSQPVDSSLFTDGRLHLFGTYTLTVSFTVPTSARVTIDASGAVTPAPVVFESRTPVVLALDGVEGSLTSGAALLFPNEAERNKVGAKLYAGGDSISLPLNGANKRLSLDLAAATASTPATLDAAIAIERNGAQINFQPGEDMATFAKLTWTIVPRG